MAEQIIINDPERKASKGKPKEKGEAKSSEKPTEQQIVNVLEGYRQEAYDARIGGLNPRDDKWRENMDLYWGRYDFTNKAEWQAQEVTPEVPNFVDRFAAALKEALVALPEGFYDIVDPKDTDRDLTKSVKKMLDIWLSKCGRNNSGQPTSFASVFEEQVKLGAMKTMCSVTTWKDDISGGRVAIETVDPSMVWLDHTGRNLYRMRRLEIDRHDLVSMAKTERKGKPVFDLPAIQQLVGQLQHENIQDKEALTGEGQEITTERSPVTIDEYYATIVMPDGEVVGDGKTLSVVANQEFLIRGPEANPFTHGNDWLTFAPMITTPLSVYGRSYMEDFASIAKTLNTLTNLILDAVYTSTIKAFAVVPDMLMNPSQVTEGFSPNKMFLLEDGLRPEDFFAVMDAGTLPAEAVTVWQSMKESLRETSGFNEIGVGQFAPNSRTSATEVIETQQSSALIIRSVAQTVEQNYLNIVLDNMWKTGLQFVKKDDPYMREAVGPEMFDALIANRKELIKRPITFQAQGLSRLLQKSKTLRSLIQLLQLIAQNELLLQEFLKKIDVGRLVEILFELSDVDIKRLNLTDREKLIRTATEPLNEAQQQAQAGPEAGADVQGAAQGAADVISALAEFGGQGNGSGQGS